MILFWSTINRQLSAVNIFVFVLSAHAENYITETILIETLFPASFPAINWQVSDQHGFRERAHIHGRQTLMQYNGFGWSNV